MPLIQTYPAIDVWEGPNEIGINPDQVAEMKWYAAFLAELGKQIKLLGSRACLGGWATGTPEMVLWQYYAPVLQTCRDYGAILGRHHYGPLDQWFCFRHRLDELEFRKLGFFNTPVIITECGGDWDTLYRRRWGNNLEGYWKDYLLPFTNALNKDSYVLGATLFSVGTGFAKAWENFDVASHPDKPSLAAIISNDFGSIKETSMEPSVSQVVIVPLGDQQTDPNSAIISMVGSIKNQAVLVQCIIDLYEYLRTHDGDPTGFGFGLKEIPKREWWESQAQALATGKITSFKCHRKPGMKWYRKPDSTLAHYNTSTDTSEMDVWNTTKDALNVDWFLVFRGVNQIWVKALETSA